MFLVTNENMGLCLNMHSIQNVLLSFQDRDFGNDSEPEPECSFRDKESQMTGSTCQSVCPSRASVDSHKSISFFIDLVCQKIILICLLVLSFKLCLNMHSIQNVLLSFQDRDLFRLILYICEQVHSKDISHPFRTQIS